MNRKKLSRTALAAGVTIAVVAAAFFILAPGIVERAHNKIEPAELPTVSAETQRLHDSLQIVDMHSDTLLWNRDILERSNRGQMDLPRLDDGNVAVQVFSSVSKSPKGQNVDNNTAETDNITLLTIAQLQPPRTWFSLLERSLYHAGKLEQAAEDSNGKLVFIRTRGDLDRVISDRESGGDLIGAMFSVEGLHNLEGDIDNLDRLYDAGMRMASFAHFFDNEVAGSMHGVDRGGLTALGREVFVELERRGVIIDIAHTSHDAVGEMLDLATKPVVLSHGGVDATCDVNRNLNDEQIRGVADTGGVVGIGYFDTAVCGLTIEAVVDAIDHVVDVAGIRTAALGSDFDGSVTVGWDTSELAAITQELVDRGYADDEIASIMGGNTLRVMDSVLPR
ncbi:MAG: membrane dipeptidase [Micrococcaceae bacterium]|uniref:dipeptidase n=1 Tax=Arthrobacter sp. 179 TaxID=3457734 RepID=UPI00264B1545|nr:membrane dipeptidase [Micrococcaceae bacterium]MDN5886080.1 membrane dipeptidase [Micrococcaceae bacterium]MDN5905372.1 membrane dipeptidase [Micrococcaceae bacterium]MDN6178415.1 membrane dipeptidase [Micrococcaceae bacterium]